VDEVIETDGAGMCRFTESVEKLSKAVSRVFFTAVFLMIRVLHSTGKSWNLKFKFPGLKSHGIRPRPNHGIKPRFWKVMENKPNGCRISDPCMFLAFTSCIIIVYCQTGFDLLFKV